MPLQIIARVEVSPLPVHIYVVNPTREVWTHSDTDGTFDVISTADVAAGNLTATKVPVSLACTSHTTGLHLRWRFRTHHA